MNGFDGKRNEWSKWADATRNSKGEEGREEQLYRSSPVINNHTA